MAITEWSHLVLHHWRAKARIRFCTIGELKLAFRQENRLSSISELLIGLVLMELLVSFALKSRVYPMKQFFLLISILFSSVLLAQPSIEIYLIRHGQTDSNLFDKSQGIHTPLNKIGEEQAAIVGKKLAFLNISQIFSSDSLRTKQTAEIISNTLGKDVPIEYTERLREGDHGNWKEKPPSEIINLRREYRLHCGPTKEAWISFKGDGSFESYEEMYQRLKGFLLNSVVPKIHNQSIPQNSSIALVTHGMMMISTLYHHLDYDPKLGFRVDNCGWVKLRLKADGTLEFVDKDEEKVGSIPFP